MKALFVDGPRSVAVRGIDTPAPGPGGVRIAVRYCGICGSDVSAYKSGGLSGPAVMLGHEISGVVDADPAGTWPPGTRVTVFPAAGCGDCVWCREGDVRFCVNPPARSGGGFAEYLATPAETLLAVPDELDDRAAALAEPLGVALRGVEQAGPGPGDLAYVSGLGSIGLLTVAGLRAAGCRVVGADPRAERRALGLEMGCSAVIDPGRTDPYDTTLEHDRRGARVAFECAGTYESLQQIFDACGHGGAVGILGIPLMPVVLLRMTMREQRAFSFSGPTRESMQAALDHLVEHPWTARVITGTVPLGRTGEALEDLAEERGGVKVLVEPGG